LAQAGEDGVTDGDDLDIGAAKGVGGGGRLVVGDEEVGDAGTVGDEDPTALHADTGLAQRQRHGGE